MVLWASLVTTGQTPGSSACSRWVAGAVFIVGALGSIVTDILWFAMLVSFALLAYVIPKS